jgi:hypothetical protein
MPLKSYDIVGLGVSTVDLLMQVDQIINTEWNALSCWDDTIYPTEQVEWDAAWLTKAIAFLESGNLNSAINELWNVGLVWNSFFDYQVWKYENDRHAAGALNLNGVLKVIVNKKAQDNSCLPNR